MTTYPPDTTVTVRPFQHYREGDTVTIGDPERQVFLEMPAEALDLLGWLADGHTVGESARRYEREHGETPDVGDFLATMTREGFVAPGGPGTPEPAAGGRAAAGRPWHLSSVSQQTARRLLSAPVLVACGLVCAAGLALIVADPGLVPGATVFLFPEHFAALTWGTLAIALTGVLVHEVAHVLAARAAGAPARIQVGHRLYVLVAETDMTGVWMAPRRQRYVAFLAGVVVDATSAALLVGLLWAVRQGLVTLPSPLVLLASAVLFTYLARLLWQCLFFLRTDFYYVIATAFGCRNLMADTEDYVRNLTARLRRSGSRVDQSHIPRRELWVVRVYALFWLGGRVVAISAFVLITVPILWGYMTESVRYATGQPSSFGSIDFLTAAGLAITFNVAGVWLWTRSLYRGHLARRAERRAAAAVAA